jgi:histone H3/H4
MSAGQPARRNEQANDPEDIGQRLSQQINRVGLNGSFSEGAIRTLWEAQSLYIEQIASEAIYQAKSNDDENVQTKHIKRAVATYVGGRSTGSKALEPFGGLLAGAGASQALTMVLSADTRTTLSISITLALLTIGIGIIARLWQRS